MKKVKISELPLCQSLIGLYTMGTDALNRSVKVPFELLKNSLQNIIYPVEGGEGEHSVVQRGFGAEASGTGAFGTGFKNKASGAGSLTGGCLNDTRGYSSFAFGEHLETSNVGEVAIGAWNETKNGLLFSVGIGTSENDRRNAIEIHANGNIVVLYKTTPILLQDSLVQVAIPDGGSTPVNYGLTDAVRMHLSSIPALLEALQGGGYGYGYYYDAIGTIDDYDDAPIGEV